MVDLMEEEEEGDDDDHSRDHDGEIRTTTGR
jgi:hypothetical protein